MHIHSQREFPLLSGPTPGGFYFQLLGVGGRAELFKLLFQVRPQAKYPHVLSTIISNQKWTTLARSRPVATSIVCLISRRREGVRSRELHHENRREALFLEI